MGPIRSRFYLKGIIDYSDKSIENIIIVVSYVLQQIFFTLTQSL
jgi:hypothetical protein